MSWDSEMAEHSRGTGRLVIPDPGDEVVISGIAGRFPESDNLTQLQENLFNKVDLVTDDERRWKSENPEIPRRSGKINNLEKFDSLFFGVHSKQVNAMDPMCRMLMEHAYEAIVDGGVNPRELRGTNTGVFIGAGFSESELTCLYDKKKVNGFGLPGCCRAMLANRISYWLGCHGPSYSVDTACSSSLYALDHAYKAIRSGQCNAALVGGANLCLHPYMTLHYSRMGVLSPDGRCKTFDADANGYCRSEAVSVIFLQKAKHARRIYAHIVHTEVNCDGFKEQGIAFPSSLMQGALLQQFYEECGIPPSSVAYVEAHGSGTQAGDPEEIDAIDRIFCPGRTAPLPIGSVKTNIGHTEVASGLCSIAKVIISMESGRIPPNLHYKRPREGVKALEEGRIQVITEPTPWTGGYVGINATGVGGANVHVLLKSHQKEKMTDGAFNDELPRLVAVSGRTEEAVITMLDDLQSRSVDVEYIGLFHNIYAKTIPSHLYRGHIILPSQGLPEKKLRSVQHYPGAKRPLWFVFSGIGSHWAGMGEGLLKIPVFAEAIKKCDAALQLYGVNVINILTSRDPKIFDNILNSFIGIAAVQIGLVDLLASVGIIPDNVMGHSVGELGCAYADGCLTAEQMILAAYFRGLSLIEAKTIRGSMAAVGLGYNELKGICPSDIDIACHNGRNNSTISGPTESIRKFVAKLQANNIFAQEIPCSNIAYHSRYIKAAGPKLLVYLKKLVPLPKNRSQKWLSTSVPRNKWTSSSAQLCSAEYHTNNLLNPVLFEETSDLIPNDAITIEIAPHGLLQAILRRCLNENVVNIALTKRGHTNNVEHLLHAIGKMYEVGLEPQLISLYPAVAYPVSRGTPMISPLVRWEHSEDWFVSNYSEQEKIVSGGRVVQLSTSDPNFKWMEGHVIAGRTLVPASVYLELIWETMGLMRGELYTEISVVFEDVMFHRATVIPNEGSVELTLMIHKGSGRFEVIEDSTAIVTGSVRAAADPTLETINSQVLTECDEDSELCMTKNDVYKELRLRGYQYTEMFCGIRGASLTGKTGRVAWENNWATFIDNMAQFHLLGMDTRGLLVAIRIQKLVIDTKMHSNQILTMISGDKEFTVQIHKDLDIIVSGGVEIQGLKTSAVSRKKSAEEPLLENFKFVAHRDRAKTTLAVITRIATHIALENHRGINVKTIELIDETADVGPENLVSPLIQEVLDDSPLLQADINVVAPIHKFANNVLPSSIRISALNKLPNESGALLVVGHGLFASEDRERLQQLYTATGHEGFLLATEPLDRDSNIASTIKREGFTVVLQKRTDKELVILVRKKVELPDIAQVIKINNHEFTWLSTLQAALKAEGEKESGTNGRILLVNEGDFESGLLGFVNCLRGEPGAGMIQGLFIQDPLAPKFSLENPLYFEQLELGLALNVLRPGESWGSYQFSPMPPLSMKPVSHIQLSQINRGDLSALTWVEGKIRHGSRLRDIVKVHYSSLNCRDIMLGTGKLAPEAVEPSRQLQEHTFGVEYSGIDENGCAVMGMIKSGAFSNFCVVDRDFFWPVPDNWTLEDAATVPFVYSIAYSALVLSGRMKQGDKVLIHAGSGGVGQAAITLALHGGCEVFTTVGSREKRQFIRSQFPQIDDDHIGNSEDTSFEQWIIRKTRGQGVDIVLNSLSPEKLQASVRCLARLGRFLEIGISDVLKNNLLGMVPFLKEISFTRISIDLLFNVSSERKSKLAELLQKGIRSGVVKPLDRKVFAQDQLEAAFRHMAAGKHIGKVIVKIREQNDEPQSRLSLALPRYYCSEDGSYLILGGLGGIGLELADWLVLRGAKKIVFTSRKGISNGYQRARINIWENYGVKIVVVVGKDASTRQGCEDILKEAIALGPVDAIFNLAVVIKDGLCINQTIEAFKESLKVKAWATKQLDILSRILCPRLRHFVVFSSSAGARGYPGRTNYAMANSIMERICETRVAENLPGLAIQWGFVGDVGLAVDKQEDHKEVSIYGTLHQSILSCLQKLDDFLQQDSPIVSSIIVAEKRVEGARAKNIIDTVMNIMGLKDLDNLSLHTPLLELGMDSIMAVEINQTLKNEFGVSLTARDIRSLHFEELKKMSLKQHQNNKVHANKTTDESNHLSEMKLLIRSLDTNLPNTDICVPLSTHATVGRAEVFIIPGIEETQSIFQSLASKLTSQASFLLFGTTPSNLTSIEKMADYLVPHIKTRNEDHNDFVIVGYSFGSMIAIELVRRLESSGCSARLVLINGSPDYMKALVHQLFTIDNDEKLQASLLFGMMNIIAPSIATQLIDELEKCNTWEQKLTEFTKNIRKDNRLGITPEDQRAICSSIYYRVKAILNYDPPAPPPLQTPITLIRPKIGPVNSMSEDYGLKSITQKEVTIHYVEGNDDTILDDDICAAAINGELS